MTYEKEMQMWLRDEDLDVAFLVEADTNNIATLGDYQIEGYETVIPKTFENKKRG
jgi:hypothetical protein